MVRDAGTYNQKVVDVVRHRVWPVCPKVEEGRGRFAQQAKQK